MASREPAYCTCCEETVEVGGPVPCACVRGDCDSAPNPVQQRGIIGRWPESELAACHSGDLQPVEPPA